MKKELTHEEIVKRCVELDDMAKEKSLTVHYVDVHRRTFRIASASTLWCLLNEGERYCMVKHNNCFLTEEEVDAAIDRIFQV